MNPKTGQIENLEVLFFTSRLVAAVDSHDSVDRFAFGVRFFAEIECFDRRLEKLRRGLQENRVQGAVIAPTSYAAKT